MNYKVLAKYGIDFDGGLARCMGDTELYETMMSMFLDDDTFSRAKMAYEKNYYKELFRSLHELKGTSGSASLTELNAAVVPLVELLRGGNDVPRQLLATMFERVEKSYFKAIEGISLAFALHD